MVNSFFYYSVRVLEGGIGREYEYVVRGEVFYGFLNRGILYFGDEDFV